MFGFSHHVFDVLIHATAATARSSVIGVALLVIGSPLSLAFWSRLGRGSLTIPLAAVFGLFVLTIASWYAFRFGIHVQRAYLGAVAIGLACTAFAGAKVPLMAKAALSSSTSWTAAAFIVPVFAFQALCFAKLNPDGLALLTTGNNDIFAYIKFGKVLSALPNVNTTISGREISPSLTRDVFAAMNLESFASFILRVDIERCALPVFGFAVGLVSLGIVAICRTLFDLSIWVAIVLALLLTLSTLFTHLVLNYFLGQILFEGVLLASLFYIAQVSTAGDGSVKAALAVLMVGSVCVMFAYPPWFIQYTAFAAAAVGLAALLSGKRPTFRRIGVAALLSVVVLAASNGFSFIVSPARYLATSGYLIRAASSEVAGWPLPFIDLKMLVGLPGRWPLNVARDGFSATRVFPGLLIFAIVAVFYLRNDSEERRGSRQFMLACFFAATALYLVAWGLYGESYRQWKFATTLPLPLGFVIAACVLFALPRALIRSGKMLRVVGTVALLITIAANIWYFQRDSAPAKPFPIGLKQIAAADTDENVKAVYIDLSDYSQRMAAAIFVNKKPIFFSGETYYGAAAKIEDLPDGMIAVFRETCDSRIDAQVFELVDMPKSAISHRNVGFPSTLSFAGPVNKCMTLSGFSSDENWGRWTDGRSASIEFLCDCDVSKQNAQVTINASTFLVPGKVDRQRVIFRVNGSEPQEKVFDTTDRRNIALAVPPTDGDPSRIAIKIELPDATPPSVSDSPDTRLLGLGIVKITLGPRT